MEKVLTIIAAIATLAFGAAIVTWNLWWLLIAVVGVACVVLGNRTMLRWFWRQRGLWFTLRVVPVRLLFYLLSGIGAGWAILTHRFQDVPSPVTPLHDRADAVAAS